MEKKKLEELVWALEKRIRNLEKELKDLRWRIDYNG